MSLGLWIRPSQLDSRLCHSQGTLGMSLFQGLVLTRSRGQPQYQMPQLWNSSKPPVNRFLWGHKYGTSRPLQGNRTQSLWPRQELPDPYNCPISHIVMPPPTFEQPCLLLPAPTRKGMWPTSHPAPIGALQAPTNHQVYPKTPLSPTSQQVSRCIIRPLLSLGYKNRHDHAPGVGSPRSSGSCPAMLAAPLISINSSFTSPCYESGKLFF